MRVVVPWLVIGDNELDDDHEERGLPGRDIDIGDHIVEERDTDLG